MIKQNSRPSGEDPFKNGSPFARPVKRRKPDNLSEDDIKIENIPTAPSEDRKVMAPPPIVGGREELTEVPGLNFKKQKRRKGVPKPTVPEYDTNIDKSKMTAEEKAEHYLKQILILAIENAASDIHFISGEQVYIRRKDDLIPITEQVIAGPDMLAMLTSNMPKMAKEEFLKVGESDYAIYPWGIEQQRFRVNAFTAQGMPGAVMRLITNNVPSLEDLDLPEKLRELSTSKDGLFLIAGATGSGKSTTLAAMLNHVNETSQKRIFTIEDPVEILHKNKKSLLTQREVGEDTLSFNKALRSAMRQNPDIILIGEIRDQATAEAAIQAAQTGHFVLSTIHAGTAEETLERFANIFPAEDRENIKKTLAYTLRGIVAQRLVIDVDNERLPLLEIMSNTHRIEQAIYQAAEGVEGAESVSKVIEESNLEGMQTIDQHLVELVMQKRISPRTAMSQSVDRLKLIQNLKLKGLSNEDLRQF